MKRKFSVYQLLHAFLILYLLSVTGCEKDPGKPGPEKLTGSLVGAVNIVGEYNYYHIPYTGSLGGIDITAYNDEDTVSSLTNENGVYQLEGLHTGIYTIECKREDCGLKKETIDFLGGNVPEITSEISIYETSSTVFTNFDIVIDEFGNTIVSGTANPAGTNNIPSFGLIFMSTSSDVSPTNYEYMNYIWRIETADFEFEMDYGAYRPSMPGPGLTLYARAYGTTIYQWADNYFDEELGLQIYNVNSTGSDLATFTLP